jgi:hypothetical protein
MATSGRRGCRTDAAALREYGLVAACYGCVGPNVRVAARRQKSMCSAATLPPLLLRQHWIPQGLDHAPYTFAKAFIHDDYCEPRVHRAVARSRLRGYSLVRV